jgi:hypothetical protein
LTSQFTLRGETENGETVIITFGVRDGMIVAWKHGDRVAQMFSPPAISRCIQGLRRLQAQALYGVSWPVEETGRAVPHRR